MILRGAPTSESWAVINFYRNDLTECSYKSSEQIQTVPMT